MTDALEDHEGTVSTGGRTITNLRFADDIDGLAGEEEELATLVERLDKAFTAYSIEVSAEKTKLLTNNTCGINTEIRANGQKPETVTSFKYLGSVITNKGSKPEILSRIAQTTAALTRLKPVWNDMSVSLSSKIRLKLSEPISTSACRGTPVTVGKLGNVRSGKQVMPTQREKKRNQLKSQSLICLRRRLDYQ